MNRLEGDGLALSDREQRLRILLDRIAQEGEDDLAAERRRGVSYVLSLGTLSKETRR